MTNDDIDAIILERYRIDGYLSGEWKVSPDERAIFRAGMEAAAKICERVPIDRSHRDQRDIDYMAMGALVCRDAIRAAANAQSAL